jgi:hypothetical protein
VVATNLFQRRCLEDQLGTDSRKWKSPLGPRIFRELISLHSAVRSYDRSKKQGANALLNRRTMAVLGPPQNVGFFKANNVFSTTAKVFLTLLIISAVIGVAFPTLGGLGSAVVSANSTRAGATGEEEADMIRNSAPVPEWDSIIVKAVTNRCVPDGMNGAEVLRAIGEPNERFDGTEISSWSWHPRKLNEATIFFTPNGNVYPWDSGCKNLSGIVTP